MINVFNLRGNQRTSGELSRREGGKIFGSGSRTPIAITLLVRNPAAKGKAQIHYHDIGDYLSREEKLERIKKFASVLSPEMQLSSITPNEDNDWLNQRDGLFDTFIPMEADKKFNTASTSFFVLNSRGLETARDSWVYNSSQSALTENIGRMIDFYNQQVKQYLQESDKKKAEEEISLDPHKISWSSSLLSNLHSGVTTSFAEKYLTQAMYRPFFKQHLYRGDLMIHRRGQWDMIFPTPQTKNLVICVPGVGVTKEFSVFITDIIPDLELIGKSQCFPLYYFEEAQTDELNLYDHAESQFIRHDGITDFALSRARELNPKITREDVFYYVYGFLHNQAYRKRFSSDLKKSLPHIPFPNGYPVFKAYCKAGRELAALHLNYETGPFCKTVIVSGSERGKYHVQKMRFISKDDKRTIIFNEFIKIENIPLVAYDYVINGKSAIEWVMERYAVTTNADSGIQNDPNQWSESPRYILDLLLRVIQMSVDTVQIVTKLPEMNFPD